MPLDLKLHIPKTDLLVQENPRCTLVYTNTGKQPLQYLHPASHENSPVFRILEISTGIETFQAGHPPEFGEKPITLPPGQAVTFEFLLRDRLELTLAGEYEVRAVARYDLGKDSAESNRIKLRIRPVSARNLSMVSVSGGWSSVWYGFSVNAMGDPPSIVRHTIGFTNESAIDTVAAGPAAPLSAVPIGACPSNGFAATGQWAAWLDEGVLRFMYFDASGAATAASKWGLPAPEAAIVSPLHTDPDDDPARAPGGAALVWLGDPGARTGYVQVVAFPSPGRAVAGARTAIPHFRPIDPRSHALADGRRFVTYWARTDEGCALHTLPWPDQAKADNPPRELQRWPAEYIASGSVLDAEDTLRGATLMLMEPQTHRRPVIIPWSLDAKGRFEVKETDPVEWPYAREIIRAVVRVGPDGGPAALLVDPEGAWHFYDGFEKVAPVPLSLSLTRLPMDLLFVDRGTPMIVGPTPGQGIKVLFPDGKPLPHKCG
ncbi:MAG: hypothetical protein IT437_11950 [Phycisphaerales bacterium]|nr:hypothetical protein [Phycisphaerales bacterium]